MRDPNDAFLRLAAALRARRVRFVLIGVAAANYYARRGSPIFFTEDHDLLLPPDPANTRRSWAACESLGFDLLVGNEPLDRPRDLALARQICRRRVLVRVSGRGISVDLTMVMGDLRFADVYRSRRLFKLRGVNVPVADLRDIVRSKAQAGRAKDRLFLAAHAAELRSLMRSSGRSAFRARAAKRRSRKARIKPGSRAAPAPHASGHRRISRPSSASRGSR